MNFPIPPSHRTFTFGNVIIDSNFDSGNCSHAQKVSATNYNIWIGTDHPKNNYRTWFHFSIQGLNKGTSVTFKIKNMQNQSRLLNQGLVPVYRQESSDSWKRIKQKINLSGIQFNQGWIQWSFKHTMTSNEKVYFAFFYPWSNQQNNKFLSMVEQRCKTLENVYFHRTAITYSLQGRPIQFVTISSKRGLTNKQQNIDDKHLFTNKLKPKSFNCDKKGLVIGARVHPGQVPGSHVMTGIIDELTKDTEVGRLLRDKLVFYIFPIFNPDGVARGHYRVDTNGINLNRCYISPNPKQHSPIYAVKKIIIHLHQNNRYFGFLDLHAHASKKGIFIYGNCSNQLQKQVQICLFPKILSMNSQNFQYQGSNFTQKNMYVKQRGDHASKQGSGRVALFKATKNAFSWTLQCNYNSSRILNILQPQKTSDEMKINVNSNGLDESIIVPYKTPVTKPASEFYTIQTYYKLGRQICESFLDLLQCNPISRIQNPKNYYKSIQNLKMNLAIALLRMAPNRFQAPYKKIYFGIQSSEGAINLNNQIFKRSIQALYFLLIKKAKISNLNDFIKKNDRTLLIFVQQKKKQRKQFVRRSQSMRPNKSTVLGRIQRDKLISSRQSQRQTAQNQQFNQLKQTIIENQSLIDISKAIQQSQVYIQHVPSQLKKQSNVASVNWQTNPRSFLHIQQFKMIGLNRLRSSLGSQIKNQRAKGTDQYNFRNSNKPVNINMNLQHHLQAKLKYFPSIQTLKVKGSMKIVPQSSLESKTSAIKKNINKKQKMLYFKQIQENYNDE